MLHSQWNGGQYHVTQDCDSSHQLGCCVSLNVVRIKPIAVCFLIFAHRSPCQQCHDSVAGPDVGRSAAGIEFLAYHSNFVVHHFELKACQKLPSPPRQTFPVGNQGLIPSLHCPGSTSMALYIYPSTQTGFQSSWWDTHAPGIWQFHSDNTENCLLPAILESKRMNVTVYSP